MNKYDKPKFDEEDLGENVFLDKLEVLVSRVRSDNNYKVHDVHSGEDAIFELANYDYEKVAYCKVFADAGRRLKMVQLSPRAKDLLLWVMYEVKQGKDWIWLNKVRYMEENNIGSINTYRTALNDLIKKKYLGITVISDVYWINPDFFFNGNRIKSFPNNIKVK